MDMEFVEKHSLPFPAVTICSLSELDTRKTGRLPGVTNASHKLYDLFLVNNFWRSRVRKKSLNNPDYDDLLNMTTEKLYSVAAPTAKDMLRFCSYNGRPFKCFNNFSSHVFAPHCFHFNNNKSHTLEATRLGPMAGLVVIMEESSQSLLFGNTFSAGAKPVHNKVISGFQALRQARAPVAGLEPATEGSLQISGRTRKPLCYRRPLQLDI
ncbi:hypothetical protein PoB_007188400 [Plakobranchus ocellatus]|uniref:Uncharacterized protein n=1 Tax=Plakobranchus ocellatus TaxID=259542 RepID=A0AAV4DMH5_9GAST|nr:hypothetical protein PoB_007188400 [Plakobranchus ocellatus]